MLGKSLIKAAAGNAGEEADEDFANTVLLLHGDGTNGAQNNTFLDASTNNFTITRNGNTTQGTFSPFSKPDGRWGAYTSDRAYLTIPASSDFDLISTDFTVEFWLNWTSQNTMGFSGTNFIGNMAVSNGYFFGMSSTSATTFSSLNFVVWNAGSATSNANTSITQAVIPAGEWHHIAIVRSGTGAGNLKFYVDGVQIGSAYNSVTYSTAGSTLSIGSGSYIQNPTYSGNAAYHISNLRLTKSAVYTSDFTPSTSPLTALANTTLLMFQDSRFINNGSNTGAITSGSYSTVYTRVTPFSPFPITTAYSPSVNGGGAYFNANNGYLTIPYSSTLEFGSSDWTVEMWVYVDSTHWASSPAPIINYKSDTNSHYGASFGTNNPGYASLALSNNGGSWTVVSTSTDRMYGDAWNHIAFVRSGANIYIYTNGVRYTASTTYSGIVYIVPNVPVIIGRGGTGGNYQYQFKGSMSGLRVVKGTALYTTSSFTPPTTPPTAVSGTNILCNYANAGILDNTCFNALETVGNAQIDTTTKKYGTGAMKFDGTGDRLVTLVTPTTTLGGGNFTVECWLYKNANTAYMTLCGNFAVPSENTWQILGDVNGTKISWFNGASNSFTLTGGTTLNTGTWYHIAFVRSGSTLTLYVNGTSDGTATLTTNYDNISRLFFVGQTPELSAGRDWNGYIDDLRITKGIARYTAAFTPPDKALPNIGV